MYFRYSEFPLSVQFTVWLLQYTPNIFQYTLVYSNIPKAYLSSALELHFEYTPIHFGYTLGVSEYTLVYSQYTLLYSEYALSMLQHTMSILWHTLNMVQIYCSIFRIYCMYAEDTLTHLEYIQSIFGPDQGRVKGYQNVPKHLGHHRIHIEYILNIREYTHRVYYSI